MDLRVLLQMISSAKFFPTHCACEGTKSCVNPFVSRQFFVPGKRFATIRIVTFEWSFTCKLNLPSQFMCARNNFFFVEDVGGVRTYLCGYEYVL